MKLLFLGKVNDKFTADAWELCNTHFEAIGYFSDWGAPWPEYLNSWQGDYIVSYLSRWIIPANVLQNASKAALNFHPAPPEYPGFGPVNWALYDGATTYGVTCHHMADKVDSGPIVKVMRFAVEPDDDVQKLLQRAHTYQASLFNSVMFRLIAGEQLPVTDEQWCNRKRTRQQLDNLATLRPGMGEGEMLKRIRATSYNQWQPQLQVNGTKYRLVNNDN